MQKAKNGSIEKSLYSSQKKLIYLREITINDVTDRYLRWMNDPEVNRFLESRFNTTTIDTLTEYVRKFIFDPNVFFFTIRVIDGNEHIGNIKLGPIDTHHRRADIGLIIGEKQYWGKGYGTEAITIITRYAFEVLDLIKLTAGCYYENEPSAKAFEKCGFLREGLLRDNAILDGKPHNCLLLGITARDYWERINDHRGTTSSNVI